VKINAKVNDFYVKGDTIGLQTIGLQTIDPASGFHVKKLDTHFMICEKQMRFDQMDLRFNDSFLKDQVVMNYRDLDDLTQWIPKVRMVANLKKSQVKGEDVSRFIEAMSPYKGMYRLNGLVDGTVANLGLKNFELAFGQNSVLRGDFKFKGLPNIDKTQMDFDMKKSLFLPKDLAIFISSSAASKMQILGPVAFEGNFHGTNQRFKTLGKLNTGLGYLEGDVRMDLKDSMSLSGYEGGLNYGNSNWVNSLICRNIWEILIWREKLKATDFLKNRRKSISTAKSPKFISINMHTNALVLKVISSGRCLKGLCPCGILT